MMPIQKTAFHGLRGWAFRVPLLLILILSGCSSPEQRVAKLIGEADGLVASGDLEGALELLEKGGQDYPDNPDILIMKAGIYEQTSDFVMAAMTYDRLSNLDPQYRDRALDAARQFSAANEMESAIRSIDAYLEVHPDDPEGWILKGRYLSRMQRHEAAASSYLRAVRLMEGQIDGVLGVEIGNTFLALEQYVQAERFYRDALDTGDVAKIDAMLGLLATSYDQEQWADASEWLRKIDAIDPGIVNNSYLADVRPELERWESNRVGSADVAINLNDGPDDARAGDGNGDAGEIIIDVGPAPDGVAAGADPRSETGETVTPEPEATGIGDPSETAVADTDGGEVFDPESGAPTGKFAGVGPAVAPGDDAGEALDPGATAVAGGSGIAESSAQVRDDDATVPGGGKLAAAGVAEESAADSSGTDPAGDLAAGEASAVEVVDVEPTPFDLAVEMARDGRHNEAIREYWKILAEDVDQPEVWNRLSRSYRANQAWSDAEATALEAMRREPRNIVYTFDYLKAVENSRSPERFLEELERAYARIPNSPDLVLALARAYVDIEGNARNAAVYYRLFLEMAPNHPESFSAEQELAVLRVR